MAKEHDLKPPEPMECQMDERGYRRVVAVSESASLLSTDVSYAAVSQREFGERKCTRVAILLSCHTFEQFYERGLGLTSAEYIGSYRNDWPWEYAAALREYGFDIALYLPSTRHSGAARTNDGYLVRFLPVHSVYQPWDRIPALRRSPLGRYIAELVNTLAFLLPLRRALAEDDVEVLYLQEYWTARFDVLALNRPIPIVAVEQSRSGRRQVSILKRWTFPRAAALQVQTLKEEQRLGRYKSRVTRLTNFVNADFWRPTTSTQRNDRVLLAVGRLLDKEKRLSDAICALALLPMDWRFIVIGRGPDRENLKRLAETLGVSERITFRDFEASRENLRSAYQECTVFTLPSALEGLPVALLEAMSCGAAVVATDIDGVREIISHRENGLLVPVGRPDLLAEAIQVASETRSELGGAARRTIETGFSRSVVGDRLAALLHAAIGRRTTATS